MSNRIEQLITESGLTITDRIQVGKSQYKFICQCPTLGCSKTMVIMRERDLTKKCRTCANQISAAQKKKLNWVVITTEHIHATTSLAKANQHLFIKEEIVSDPNNGANKKKRVILKCPTPLCSGILSSYDVHKTKVSDLTHSTCRYCADVSRRKKPFEYLYNSGKRARNEKNLRKRKTVHWLLSYEEFVTLCYIPNCHYCNRLLNRAEYKSNNGTTAILLDRKDSNKDYTLDNCVPCCPDCNFTKNEWISYEEMILIMKHRGLWCEAKI